MAEEQDIESIRRGGEVHPGAMRPNAEAESECERDDYHVVSEGEGRSGKEARVRSSKSFEGSSSSSDQETGGSESSPSGSDDQANSSVARKPASRKKEKRDRSKLRKGKWTVEEEEYTTRIIHYFSTGLLTLPEGSTLRSYLADKLNCDPMRITKKYAGASCLGRRAYHFRNRPQPSVAEIQLAKVELDLLEKRFRLRVEEGRPGIPLPRLTMAQPPFVAQQPAQTANQAAIQSLLVGLIAASSAPNPATAMPHAPQVTAPSPAAPGLQQSFQAPSQPAPAPTSNQTALNHLLADLLLAKAASLSASQQAPTGQLYVQNNANAQITALQPPAPPVNTSAAFAEQLRQTYENHLRASGANSNATMNTSSLIMAPSPSLPVQSHAPFPSLAPPIAATSSLVTHASQMTTSPPAMATASNGPARPTEQNGRPLNRTTKADEGVVNKHNAKPAASKPKAKTPKNSKKKSRTDEDQAAGTILIGFISSLRDSYEEALKSKTTDVKDDESVDGPMDQDRRGTTRKAPANVTDSSSQQPDSSVEDSEEWNSDKKTDPSYSEESDKEEKECTKVSKGPPRKRLKSLPGSVRK